MRPDCYQRSSRSRSFFGISQKTRTYRDSELGKLSRIETESDSVLLDLRGQKGLAPTSGHAHATKRNDHLAVIHCHGDERRESDSSEIESEEVAAEA